MKVVMNVQTSWKGVIVHPGYEIDVEQKVAERWVKKGLAYYGRDNRKPIPKAILEEKYQVKKQSHEKVTIVVPIKDQLEYVKKCIYSIKKYTDNYELILIDNGSDEKTRRYLDSTGEIVIHNKENMGFPYACNQGIKKSTCDFVCFLNSDTFVTHLWLDKMMLTFKKIPGAGIIGASNSYCGNQQCIKSAMAKRNRMSEEEMNKLADSLEEGYDRCPVVGLCYLIRKSIIDTVGGFNHKRFLLGNTEENEFTWRVEHMTRYKSFWCKSAYVHHYGHKTFKGLGIEPAHYNTKERNRWVAERKNVKCKKFDISDVEV